MKIIFHFCYIIEINFSNYKFFMTIYSQFYQIKATRFIGAINLYNYLFLIIPNYFILN